VLNDYDILTSIDIVGGLDCDKLPNSCCRSKGKTNPIPVNGIPGAEVYRSQLIERNGFRIDPRKCKSEKTF